MSGNQSTYVPSHPVAKWVEDRLPIIGFAKSTLIDFPTPKNLNYWWTFGGILAFMLGVQIVTGIVLAMHYTPNAGLAFDSVEMIKRDVNGGRLIQAVQTSPQASASALFPDAARANPSIFYRGGRSATVSEVYANLTATGGAKAAASDRDADQAFIQYASGRRADRLQQEQAVVDLVLRGSQQSDSVGSSIFDTAMLRAAAYARSDNR